MTSLGTGTMLRPAAGRFARRAGATAVLRDRTFRRALLIADVIAAALSVGVAQLVWTDVGAGSSAIVLPLLVPFVYTASGLYRRDELVLSKTSLDEAPAVFRAATFSAMLAYFIESLIVRTPLGAQFLGLGVVSLSVLTLITRLLARMITGSLTPPERCLVLGNRWAENRLRDQLSATRAIKAEVVGRQRLGELTASTPPGVLTGIDRVVVAADDAAPEQVHETIRVATQLGVKVSVLPRMFEVVGSAVAFDYIGGLTLLGVRRFGLSRRARVVKRTFDVAGSATALLVLSPLLLGIALLVRFTSPGPSLFRQTRVGRDGRTFQMLKFRSMVAGADGRKSELRSLNEADGLFKITDDPRLTAVGRVLRRMWLDELPQLFNVLRGDMSLVGPRPLVLDEDEKIVGWRRQRLYLTPGMTGPWQVLGAARVPLHEMVTIDYLYVANWSLWNDVKILLRTVPCVLARRGQ
jgi:exopolysaccharide biosynthesis polyprenyl glycosylphosphotransferase